MNILVCVKQVPDTMEVKIDEENNRLIRDGVPYTVNPFDSNAVELAVRMKERYGACVTVLSMGPVQASESLRECLAVGADDAFLISGREFGGSDTLATSRVLSEGIKKIAANKGIGAFDLILCGRQSSDSDTAQVGPETAEFLAIPQVTYATDIEKTDAGFIVTQAADGRINRLSVTAPCLVTIGKIAGFPRYSNMMSKIASMSAAVPVLSAEDLPAVNPETVGLLGSPTKMTGMQAPKKMKSGEILDGGMGEIIPRVAEILADQGFI
ncbi:MAG: electron transfer flavoprotein subunit beta/FixA family protein [Clostridiales Family XIII bacterium]|jgi:electron transfer flavoprotein beta subunit|nr:electron transfer flavoprotein subunit beta/FixA family protein [Clostridiales Family XIII bacterium]